MSEIIFKGLVELQDALRDKTKLESVKKIVKLNGSEMQQQAQRNAPVDTGTLKRSIGLNVSDGGMTAKVEAKTDYAPYVEFGTRYMNAQPYMKPAFNQQKGKFKRDLDRLTQ